MDVQFDYDNTILAFIDILGYKDLIENKNPDEIYSLIYEALYPRL